MSEDVDGQLLMQTGDNASAFLALLEKIATEKWWWEYAACDGMAPTDPNEPDPFFPPMGGSPRGAIEVCETCPVRRECERDHAHERFGVWGGRSVESLRARRRRGEA